MIVVLAYLAVVLTAIAATLLAGLRRYTRLTAPAVLYTGHEIDSYPGLLIDPADTGGRLTELVVASPARLVFLEARYTVQFLDEPRPRVVHGTHAQTKTALLNAGIDDATFGITLFSPGSTLVPGREHVAFVLALPLARRLAKLEAEMDFADPTGRRVTKLISALPRGQQLGRPVTAAERRAAAE